MEVSRMFSKLVVAFAVSALTVASAACAAPVAEDEGTVESQSSAYTKKRDSGTNLSLVGKVSSSCIDGGGASVRFGAELFSSGATDSVVVSIEGAFTDTIELSSNAWSKNKGNNWAFVASTATLGNGEHSLHVCATQSGDGRNAKQTCATYSAWVDCGVD
jgi:hypothetical protein